MKELKLLKYATIGFMLFILFWMNFGGYILGTQGRKEDTKAVQAENTARQDSKLEAKEEDAEILGKFYNEKGYFIVVYDEDTKAPEVFQVDFSEWNLISVGDTY